MIKLIRSRFIIVSLIILFMSLPGQSQVIQANTKNKNIDYEKLAMINDRESGKSRGFGFVEMDVVAEGQAAMKALNNKEIEGRSLSVSVAKEKSARTDNKRW